MWNYTYFSELELQEKECREELMDGCFDKI